MLRSCIRPISGEGTQVAKKVFYSFHYQVDAWRVQTVMNAGQVEGQPLLGSQDWEDVAAGGDAAIKKWIDDQMKGKSCNVVLIGSQTAGRKWIEYEIGKAWGAGKGVVGVYIHGLKDANGKRSTKGANPFSRLTLDKTHQFDQIAMAYNPAGSTSQEVYNSISSNLERWVDEAIAIRKKW